MPRAALVAATVAAVAFVFPAAGRAAAPSITLLTPPNGSTIISSESAPVYPTYTWRIDWTTPEDTIVRQELALDPFFSQNLSVNTHFCPAANVNCWTDLRPQVAYATASGRAWYWRIGVTTSAGIVYSSTSMFIARFPPDLDRDGIEDARDNCPSIANVDQRDSNRDGKGDACQVDRVKPRVVVFRGSARRGARAFLKARVADDRDFVRLYVTLSYRGRLLYRGTTGYAQTRWAVPETFYTLTRLPRRLPAGRYLACVQAWDKAGNSARGCAPYRVR